LIATTENPYRKLKLEDQVNFAEGGPFEQTLTKTKVKRNATRRKMISEIVTIPGYTFPLLGCCWIVNGQEKYFCQ